MPLPPIIQPTDTFNIWLDATNNVISHIGNTDVYIQVAQNATPSVSTGNLTLNGIATVTQVVATGNVVLGGANSACTIPVFGIVNNATPTLNVIADTVGIAAVNIEFTGTNLNIASNVVANGLSTFNANTSFTKNVTFSGANTNIGGGRLTITANAQFTANTNVTGTTFNVTANSVFQGSVIVNSATLTVNAVTTFNEGLVLGGPVSWSNAHIFNTTLTGAGIQSLVLGANVTILRINATGSGNLISSIESANISQYRHLTVFNLSPNPIYFQHGNTAATTNAIYCPGNTDFMIPTQGTALLYYDANTSVQRWRVISAPIGMDPLATVSSSGSVGFDGTQTFGGNKVFQNTVTVTANLFISNATANVQITPRTITFEGATTINSTSYTGTSNNSTNFNGQLASYYTNAANISTGTLSPARLPSANVSANGAIDTTTQSFAGVKTFTANVVFSSTVSAEQLRVTRAASNTVVLTDGATVSLDASLGSGLFVLSATGNRTVAIPTNAVDGQKIVIKHYASGGDRTLSLASGTGGFLFGLDITTLTATTSGTSDFIGCIYQGGATNKWFVVAYAKGFSA